MYMYSPQHRRAPEEDELHGIADTQEVSVHKLVELVRENIGILSKMRVGAHTAQANNRMGHTGLLSLAHLHSYITM